MSEIIINTAKEQLRYRVKNMPSIDKDAFKIETSEQSAFAFETEEQGWVIIGRNVLVHSVIEIRP